LLYVEFTSYVCVLLIMISSVQFRGTYCIWLLTPPNNQ